jgi:hypothetical protein
MKKQLTKKCTKCQQVFPKTQKHFSLVWSKARQKSYLYPKCRTCSRKLNKEYREANVQKLRESHRKYDQSPKGIYKKLKHSARSWKMEMTQEEFVGWYLSQPKTCSYCGIDELTLKVAPDAYNNKTRRMTIDRIDSMKHYTLKNITLCCLRCNHIKGNFFTQSEMVEIGSMFIKPKWNKYAKKTI